MKLLRINSPLKHPTGKGKLASLIVACMPEEHRTYVEPFCGSAAVLYAKDLSPREIINDIDSDWVFLHQFIRDQITPETIRELRKRDWRFSKEKYKRLMKQEEFESDLDRFYNLFYRNQFGRSGKFVTTADPGPEKPHIVKSSRFDALLEMSLRLQGVEITQEDALAVLKRFAKRADAVIYLDPPYLKEWRSDYGKCELTDESLAEMAAICSRARAKIMISYNDDQDFLKLLKGFRIFKISVSRTNADSPYRDVEILAFNFEPPREVLERSRLRIKKISREEQRERLEREIGDWYMVKQPKGKTFPFVMQYHVRGISTRQEIRELARKAQSLKGKEEIAQFLREHELFVLATSWDELKRDAQKADDARANVTAAIRKHVTQTPDREKLDLKTTFNIGNVHLDFRMLAPEGSYLIGWTNDVPKVAIQTLEDELIFPLRDRILENKPGDQWLSQKKLSQPLGWLDIVSPRKPVYEAAPGHVGATVETAGRFLFKASGKLVYGISKTDYHEYFLFFKQEKFKHLDGRWDWKLIPSRKEYSKAPEDQFWMGSRPWKTQKPYILTHDRKTEEEKARRDKIQMIWNEETLTTLEELGYKFIKFQEELPILKVIKEKRLVIAPLLVPFQRDAQGDIIKNPEAIEDAAHAYLSKHRQIYFMHEKPLKPNQVEVVESWIARDLPVPEGTWLGAVKVHDDKLWEKIKRGEIRGFSVGGRGIRRELKS